MTSKSAMTPWRSGRIAEIVAGVRPIIRRASSPTACTLPLSESTATTDGSDSAIPRPRSNTSVLAVPRSIAMSRPLPPPPKRDIGESLGRVGPSRYSTVTTVAIPLATCGGPPARSGMKHRNA